MAKYPGDDEALDLFTKRFQAARDARKKFDERCELIDKHYEPWAANWPKPKDGRIDLRTPHIFHIIETMSANMVEPDPDFDVRPREYSDEDSIKATKAGLRYGLERMGWAKINARFVRQGNRYGLSVLKVLWDRAERSEMIEREAPHPNPLMRIFGKTITEKVEEIKIVRDDPYVSFVHREDFWWQPGASCIEEAEWVMHRMYLPLDVLKMREEDGVYRCVDMVSAGAPGDGQASSADASSEDGRRRVDEDGVELIEVWDKVRGKLTTIANRSVVIRLDDFPYDHEELPFAVYTPIPVEGKFEGIAPAEVLIGLQEAVWQMEGDRMDAVAKALNPPMLVDKALKGGTEFHFKPGARIFVTDPSQIKQLQVDVQSAAGLQEVQSYLGYMQQVSGVSPYIAGSDPSGYGIDNKTATGVNQLSAAAGRRIGFHIGNLQDAIARVGRQVIQLMHQYMDGERLVRIVGLDGEQWVRLTPDEIPANFDIAVKGSTESLNKQAERQQAIELLQTIQPWHGLTTPDGRQLDASKAVDYAIETFDMNPDRFYASMTPEVQAQQQAEAQQAEAQAAQAQGEAQMAQPDMQMMMQQAQQQPSPNDLNGDGVEDLQRKVFESMNFKDLPVDAQAALLEQRGLPSQGLMQQDQLDTQAQIAKIRQMTAQAAGQSAGRDNA